MFTRFKAKTNHRRALLDPVLGSNPDLVFKFIFLLGGLLSVPNLSLAQPKTPEKESSKYGTEYQLHTGPLLPNQITGMTEIVKSWGGGVGIPLKAGVLECGAINGRGDGVEYYNPFVSLRGDVKFEDLFGIFYIGLDVLHYRPADSTEFLTVGGGHVGTGIMIKGGGQLWFRSDMKFNVNPGTALYIGFGIMLRGAPGASGGGETGP